jgi:hypothetical protein
MCDDNGQSAAREETRSAYVYVAEIGSTGEYSGVEVRDMGLVQAVRAHLKLQAKVEKLKVSNKKKRRATRKEFLEAFEETHGFHFRSCERINFGSRAEKNIFIAGFTRGLQAMDSYEAQKNQQAFCLDGEELVEA